MLKLEDLHAQLLEALNINSIESVFTFEYFTDLINEQRSLWIRNEYNKNRSIDPYILQELPCVELELVDPHNCCITVPTGCKILRTVKPIPNTIEFNFNKGITSVGPVDMMKPRFNIITYSRAPYVGNGRTTARSVYAFLYQGYMYIMSKDSVILNLKYISMLGIFEDPTILGEFINCTTGNTCWSPASPYPLNQWMWAYMKPYIVQQLVQKMAFSNDDANDAQDGVAGSRGLSRGNLDERPAQQ
jgi:hypothetical protein